MECANSSFHVNFHVIFCVYYLLPWYSANQKMLLFQKIRKKKIVAWVAYKISSLTQFLLIFLHTGEQTRLNRSCASSICQNGGVCSLDVGAGTHFCQCTVNYQGRFCETRKLMIKKKLKSFKVVSCFRLLDHNEIEWYICFLVCLFKEGIWTDEMIYLKGFYMFNCQTLIGRDPWQRICRTVKYISR